MDMLLTKRDKQKYTIFLVLLSANRYWTVSEISSASGLGIATVQMGSIELEKDLEHITKLVQLIKSSRGIMIERTENTNSYFLKTFYLKNGLPFQFFDELFRGEISTFTQFAEKHYVSYSSFFNWIKGLKKWLTVHKVEIPKVASSLVGDEMQIRNIAFEIYSSVYNYSEWPFQEFDKKELKKKISLLYNELNAKLTIQETEAFCLFMAVSYHRIKNGHTIKKNTYLKVDKSPGKFYQKYYLLLEKFYGDFHLSPKILESEIAFLCFYIATTPYDYANRKHTHLTDEKKIFLEEDVRFVSLTNEILLEFNECIHFKPQFDPTLNELKLELYSVHCIAQYFIEPEQKNYFYNNKKEEEKIMPILEDIIERMGQKYTNNTEVLAIFTKKKYLVEKYMAILYKYIDWKSYMKNIKILLISSVERTKQEMLAQEISNRTKHIGEVEINTVEYDTNYDLIISDTVNYERNAVLIFFWERYPTVSDWERLKKLIGVLNNQKN